MQRLDSKENIRLRKAYDLLVRAHKILNEVTDSGGSDGAETSPTQPAVKDKSFSEGKAGRGK